ncbi:4-hydroxythreonine-4-phosphate dehydrogenase PdxA [Pseudodesulfovibrio cashew]|uniref:4-hydroxythreonine-4-phosphate dehydrogenase PdxA n=1 Tax=Pseudodesulfovibrio cashew TaxID=2678688 RepID=A0A6I6JK91_9BACT|nr:4-hydroxythreonine-4-phosphate dehydrogenase PdxA [Pseudodesulfovibrio cashew]QGY40732.1 4-hydroxythreonine-4-phosphate dehydrogenase PdxA [Pseudodesulfovibrio cashew]
MRTICITLGDPCGLGPELVARHFKETGVREDERVLLIGPEAPLLREDERCGVVPFHERLERPDDVVTRDAGVYLYEPPQLAGLEFPLGEQRVEGGKAAGESMEVAVALLRSGTVQGLLTCPLNKAMLQLAGFDFPGHTEFLAERLGVGADKVCMHLCGHDPENLSAPKLRVSLVTTHPALRDVPGLVTRERILHCLRLTDAFVRAMGFAGPVAVCGLNPHAGESGRIGDEEALTVEPAIEEARREGLDVAGPIPADTLFHFAAKGDYPAVLAMYHDQGLGPLKLLHFSEAVNVTLGLPCPRTSPDHGTGYDIAGTGKASIKSFQAAYDMLRRLVAAGS